MPVYARAEALYAALRPMFAQVQTAAPECFDGLQKARLSVRLKTTNPATEVLLDGRRGPVQVSFGPGPARADLEAEISADNLHLMLLGELSIKKAMANRLIRVRGTAWKLSVLIAVIQAGRRFYPEIVLRAPV
jgi:hypothetical protein